MKAYRVNVSQYGHGYREASVTVMAQNEDEARETALESDLDWRVIKFSGHGYEVHDIREVPGAVSGPFPTRVRDL